MTLFLWKMRCFEAVIIIKMSKYKKVYLTSMIIIGWCRLIIFLEFIRENFWCCISQIYHSVHDPQPSRFLILVVTKSNLDNKFIFYQQFIGVAKFSYLMNLTPNLKRREDVSLHHLGNAKFSTRLALMLIYIWLALETTFSFFRLKWFMWWKRIRTYVTHIYASTVGQMLTFSLKT